MKHLKKFESVNNTIFTIYTFEPLKGNHQDTVMALYIDDKLRLKGNYGDDLIYEHIYGFILGANWAGAEFEPIYITCKNEEISKELIYETEMPESLNELESMINGKDMGLL